MRIEVDCPKCQHRQKITPYARRMRCANCHQSTPFEELPEWQQWSRFEQSKAAKEEKPK